MGYYAKVVNNVIVEYPIYEGDLRLRFRNVSFPSPFVPPEGYELVQDVFPPEVRYDQALVEITPVRENGVLQRRWNVIQKSPEELQDMFTAYWDSVRRDRNRYLTASDWTQLPDAPITNKEQWTLYRQELRDITDNFTNPFEVVWPEPPAK